MKTYAKDPRWITVKYSGHCARCGAAIRRGDKAFYYPSERSMYCDADPCGKAADRDFTAGAEDEEAYMSLYGYR